LFVYFALEIFNNYYPSYYRILTIHETIIIGNKLLFKFYDNKKRTLFNKKANFSFSYITLISFIEKDKVIDKGYS